jgi:hypothetical protein
MQKDKVRPLSPSLSLPLLPLLLVLTSPVCVGALCLSTVIWEKKGMERKRWIERE